MVRFFVKHYLTILLILLAAETFGQASKPSKLIVDCNLVSEIQNENQTYLSRYSKVLEIPDGKTEFKTVDIIDTIKADLVVNHDPKLAAKDQIYINSSRAKISGDTLKITLFHHGYVFIWEYEILIIEGEYQITTWFTPPINDHIVKITPMTTFLKINTTDFVRGQEIYGQTRFTGKCAGQTSDCFSKEFLIEGDFKVYVE